MRNLVIACTVTLNLTMMGAVVHAQQSTPDTGSMAYPQSSSSGQFKRPAGTGTDTGSMAYPTNTRPGQTVPGSQDKGADTGSMAYPEPRASGNVVKDTTR